MLRNSICAGLALCAGLRSHLSTRVILGYTVCCMLYALFCQRYAVELVFQMKNYFQSGRRVVCIQKGDLSPKWAPRVALAEDCFVPKVGAVFCTPRQQKTSSASFSVLIGGQSRVHGSGISLSLSLYIYVYTHVRISLNMYI